MARVGAETGGNAVAESDNNRSSVRHRGRWLTAAAASAAALDGNRSREPANRRLRVSITKASRRRAEAAFAGPPRIRRFSIRVHPLRGQALLGRSQPRSRNGRRNMRSMIEVRGPEKVDSQWQQDGGDSEGHRSLHPRRTVCRDHGRFGQRQEHLAGAAGGFGFCRRKETC